MDVQEKNGEWKEFTYNQMSHSYHSRVAWSLLELFDITKNENLKEAARKNINWVLKNQQKNGWFNKMGFDLGNEAYTHTVAYTLRGLLESFFFFDNHFRDRILKSILKSTEKLLILYNNLNYFPGKISHKWKSSANYICITGSLQLSIFFLKLYRITHNMEYYKVANDIIERIKRIQLLNTKNLDIRGAIQGSFPIWGEYQSYNFPNWAAKYFCDALIEKMELIQNFKLE